jgi:hypothetical protein
VLCVYCVFSFVWPFFLFFTHFLLRSSTCVTAHRDEFVPGGCSRVRSLTGTVTFRRPLGPHGALLPRLRAQFQIGQRRRRSHPGRIKIKFDNISKSSR